MGNHVMKHRLRWKMFVAVVLTLLTVIILDSLFDLTQSRQDMASQVKEELATNGRIMLAAPPGHTIKNIRLLSEILQARLTVVSATGRVLADSDGEMHHFDNHLNRPEIQEARAKGVGTATRYSQTLGIDMIYLALPVEAGGQISSYLRLAKPLREVKTADGYVQQIIFRVLLVILPSYLLLVFFFNPYIIDPILGITAYTDKVKDDNITGSLIIQADDEVRQLADNLNLLVQKYEAALGLAFDEREKLAAALASMAEGIVILNRESRIELVNRGATDILGSQYGKMTGKTLLEAFRNLELQRALDRCREEGKHVSVEISLDDAQPIILNVNVAPIKGWPGADHKTIMVLHDVTQLRKLERIRVDFVANVTHEIKTPLTAIIGFVQTLQEGALEDRRQALKFLGIISEHALRLNRLVNDLLTLSSIELGEVKLHIEKIDSRKAVLQALALIEEKANEKGLVIRRDWPDELPPILADADGLIQILVNILDNAVKFTSQGSIAISMSAAEGGYLVITVTDTGIGIPVQEISRLGERFYRVDKMRSRELGGTGLGLSIVKHLLAAQKGRLEVESKPGVGTVVKLFLPVYTPDFSGAGTEGTTETL